MESFGSSSVFVWLRLWHWFGYSLVTVQEFGLSKWLLAMPLVVRGWAASLKAILPFGIETTREDEYQKCIKVSLWSASVGLGDEVCDWSPPAAASLGLSMIDSSVGRSSAQEWKGQGSEGWVTGSWDTYWHLRGPTATSFKSSTYFFKAREGLHILTFFLFLFFFFVGGFGPVFEKKSFWGIST